MPFCPKCRYEYESNVSICPDCEERLVSTLPPISEQEDELRGVLPDEIKDWVHLARLTSREYAQMLAGALRARGIPIVVLSETGYFGQTGQMGMSGLLPIGGGYSVYVPQEYVVAADIEASGILGETWQKARLVDIENAREAEDEADSEDGNR